MNNSKVRAKSVSSALANLSKTNSLRRSQSATIGIAPRSMRIVVLGLGGVGKTGRYILIQASPLCVKGYNLCAIMKVCYAIFQKFKAQCFNKFINSAYRISFVSLTCCKLIEKDPSSFVRN